MPAVPAPTAIPKPAIALASAAVISTVEPVPVESDVNVKISFVSYAVTPALASAVLILSKTSVVVESLLLSVT